MREDGQEGGRGREGGGCNWSGCNVRIRLRPRLLPTAFTAYCPLFELMSADRPSGMEGGAGVRDLDLDFRADLKAHRPPGVEHDGVPDDSAH